MAAADNLFIVRGIGIPLYFSFHPAGKNVLAKMAISVQIGIFGPTNENNTTQLQSIVPHLKFTFEFKIEFKFEFKFEFES